MHFNVGDVIDERFEVTGTCSEAGGMGAILFVKDIEGEITEEIVLKYCKEEDDEYIKRFRREVRLLTEFEGNSKVVQVLHHNVKHDPPYFVMRYYPDGDLTSLADELESDLQCQEEIINAMIACIAELHSQDVFHRDIKPQNFLCDGDSIVVSDFGLGMEPNSTSRFTSSSMFWGTQGFLPPEFQRGGFKHADASGDIFMLGKSVYVLLTRQDPTYLMDEGLPAPLFHVIERCCALDKTRRYQSLSDLKQALGLAFDVMLNRGGRLGEVNQLIATIKDRLVNEGKYKSSEVIEFIEKLSLLEHEDQVRICLDLEKRMFVILTHEKLRGHVDNFLKIYLEMIESENYGWSFAENIANNMQIIFNAEEIPARTRGKALDLAVEAATRMNRFAAMDTCNSMITSVDNNELGVHIAAIIQGKPDSFLSGIEPSQCKCDSIRAAIRAIKE
ncbi:hypothetical protein A7E78_03770 [Syntrophotalea acetylenivorans]|uniref:Protein kinase domain-containing protein n=1 Tax=Syntrophotalea acetylenivorans TaxID=1842532 RepID=A0A1L3GM52_9BACT|nr:protein kinase [Syntrophotalea acetylenivorans]APG27026.1 hypothetical protein A7E78_03770 [Syntrophotalea acetylenivorans]